jgi:hypothetical protein
MNKFDTILYFMIPTCIVGGLGIGLLVWSLAVFLSLFLNAGNALSIIIGFVASLPITVVNLFLGLTIGLILGIITIIMSPITRHNEKFYYLVMFVSATIPAFFTAILSVKILFSSSGNMSLEFLIIPSVFIALYFGLISQYLASRHLENTRQEKRKNT